MVWETCRNSLWLLKTGWPSMCVYCLVSSWISNELVVMSRNAGDSTDSRYEQLKKWKFLEGYLHCGNFPIVLFTNQSGEVDHKMSSDALLFFPSRGGAHFLILSILTGLVTWVDQTTVKVALCRFRAQAGSITSVSYCFGNSATVWKNHRCRLQEGSPCEGK